MRRGRLLAGGFVLLVVAAALVFYFAVLPGILAGDYRDSARPEHAKAVAAVRRAYDTFSFRTFADRSKRTEHAKNQAEYIRAARSDIKHERRQLRPARMAVRQARAALERVDEKALTDVPGWPLIGGSGKLGDAKDVAAGERRYIRDARRFLTLYRRLVDYGYASIAAGERTLDVLESGTRAIPDNAATPEAFARPVDATADRLDRVTRPFRRLRPPPDQHVEHRQNVGAIAFVVRELHGLASAVRARDIAKVKAFDNEITTGTRRYGRGAHKQLVHLIEHSAYTRSIERLRKLEKQIQSGYARL